MLRGALTQMFNKSHIMASVGYGMGNAILAAKNGLTMSFETAAGLIFLACPLAMAFAKQYPVAAYRVAGATVLAGTGLLATKAYITDDMALMSSCALFATTGALTMLHHDIPKLARMYTKGFLGRALATVTGYPLLVSAGIDAASLPGLAVSAVTRNDPAMLGVAGAWAVGAAGLALSDPNLRRWITSRFGLPGDQAPLAAANDDKAVTPLLASKSDLKY